MSQTAERLEVHHFDGRTSEYTNATYRRWEDRIEGRADEGEFEHGDVWTVVAEMPAVV